MRVTGVGPSDAREAKALLFSASHDFKEIRRQYTKEFDDNLELTL